MTYLADQTILVTGATGGIGAAIARALAADGARVVLHYGRNRAAAEGLAVELGNEACALSADLADPAEPARLWADAVAACGRIDALVNNAGIRTEIRVEDSLSDWQAVWAREMQVNFHAAADLSREAIRHFRGHGGGRIVNMASRAGQRGYSAEALPYGVSKAALINLTKSVARNFGQEGITAIAISPGWVRTDMAEAFIAQNGEAAALSDIPIGEMATPEEIGEITAFALRPSQKSLNGAVLDVNGASYLR
jgi:3-oxoacyl-[acyl-carrier protein] reductase